MTVSIFNSTDYAVLTVALLSHGDKCDKAIGNASATRNAWFVASAQAMLANAKLPDGVPATLDAIQAYLIASVPLRTRQARLKSGLIKDIETLPACGETVRSWFYTFRTIALAGNAHLERLVKGEAPHAVKADAKPSKGAAKGTPAKGKAPIEAVNNDPLPPVNLSTAEQLAASMKDYRARGNIAIFTKDQAALAKIMADCMAITRIIEAAAKATKTGETAKKAAKARTPKATQQAIAA